LTHYDVKFFHLKLLLNTSASFTSSGMKAFCQKWNVKLIFRGAALKQFDDDLSDPDPHIYDRSILVISSGTVFQSLGPAEAADRSDRSPTVIIRDGRMTSSEEVGDHTHRLDGTSATRHQTDAEVRVQ